MRLITLVILGALVFPGCNDGDETTVPDPSGDAPLVEYSRSGGFAPINEGLVVEADGDAVLTTGDFRAPEQDLTEFTLGEAELAALADAVATADLEGFEGGEGVCADCYFYEVEAAGTQVRFSDVDLDAEFGGTMPASVSDLVAELNAILADHTPGGGSTIGG